jgi:hypothetical protein
MSNHRILAVGDKKVRFEYYDNYDNGRLKEIKLDGVEFIKRYLQHVLRRDIRRRAAVSMSILWEGSDGEGEGV